MPASGTITRIVLKDFLTYSHVDVKPGENLNIVIGPNGSGKSSIICAIALGLGGKPIHLGRSKFIQSFIKQGKSRAEILISLVSTDKKIVTLKRVITHDKNTEWFLNEKLTTQNEVLKFIHSLNIRVDNLCQFLPQDKVTQFSKMTPQELLESTQMAIGMHDLHGKHEKLIELWKEVSVVKTQCQAEKNRLEHKTQGINRISEDVTRLEELKKNKEKLKLLKIKQTWLKYNNEAKINTSYKKKKEEILEEIKEVKNRLGPAQRGENGDKAIMAKKTNASKKTLDEARIIIKKCSKSIDGIREVQQEVKEVSTDFKNIQETEKNRILNAGLKKKTINDLQKQHENLCKIDFESKIKEITARFEEKKVETHNYTKDLSQRKSKLDQMYADKNQIGSEIGKLANIEKMRIANIEKQDRDVIKAMNWINDNRDKIPGAVVGPIALSLEIKSNAAIYIENLVRRQDLLMFISDNSDAVKFLTRKLRMEMHLKVNISYLDKLVQPEVVRIDDYTQYSFKSVLSDMIGGHPLVMSYLYQIYKIDKVMISDQDLVNRADQISNSIKWLTKFFAGQKCFTIKTSRYGNRTKSSSFYNMRQPNILSESGNDSRKRELQSQLSKINRQIQIEEDEMAKISDIKNASMAEMTAYRTQLQETNDSKTKISSTKSRIEIQQRQLREIESKQTDIEEEKTDFAEKLSEIFKRKVDKISGIQKTLTKNSSELKSVFSSTRDIALCANRIDEFDSVYNELNTKLDDLNDKLNDIKTCLSNSLKKCTVYRDEAMKSSGIKKNEQISPILKKQLQALSDDITEIEAQIYQITSQNELTMEADESLINDYHRQKKELAHLNKEIAKQDSNVKKLVEKIETLKTSWLNDVNDIISKISQNFSAYLNKLGYAGEVSLDVPDNADDFTRYGIKILVKYRDNESLQTLNSHFQSGGERSVATIIYMLALQNLTTVPFRCVDEINQGMDPVNERKVFNMIVDNACEKYQSQYFLLTPKLLKGLKYHENLCILSIYPRSPGSQDFDLQTFSQTLCESSQMMETVTV